MCPLSIKCVLSTPLADGVRVTLQAARLSGLLPNCALVPCDALWISSLVQEASPARRGYADLGCQGTRRLPQQQTLVAPSAIYILSLGPHVGAQYLCACPPSAIKGEACDVTTQVYSDSQASTSMQHTMEYGVTLRQPEPL
jgi:hypothetical protein